ncbi:MAG: phosphatase PAP2 family protein [Alphaproteobacteria bacterium]|nr:MAG: phosphatase PAP2 family protein [Alphaproteobacteria bacterium]
MLAGLAYPVSVQAGSDAFTTYGDIASWGVPVAAGVISMVKEDNDGLLQLGTGFALSMAATYGLKKTVNRTRPDGSDDESFPSGHTARAFAGASYLHYRYGLKYGVPAYILSAAVGASRVDADKHHWTDVIASAVLTNLVALAVTDRFEDSAVEVGLMMGEDEDNTYGVAARLRF